MKQYSFHDFSQAVAQQFALMQTSGVLLTVDVNPYALAEAYVDAYPSEHNLIFRHRREHDCNACKAFVRKLGNVVSISPSGVQTIWDVQVGGQYQIVADKMAELVRSKALSGYFLTEESHIGVKKNVDNYDASLTWEHFNSYVDSKYVHTSNKLAKSIAAALGDLNTTKQVFEIGLTKYTLDAAETVLELIEHGSLYKGSEFKSAVEEFIKNKKAYDKFTDPEIRNRWIWEKSKMLGMSARFRGSVISTLIEDISDGKELNAAVNSYEAKVAPQNYKRTTAPVTGGMIKKAQEKIVDLGLTESIHRRFAEPSDISVNNVLFHAQQKKAMNVLDDMMNDVDSGKPKDLSKSEHVSIEKFLTDILPTAKSLEVLFENKMQSNLMTLIAPTDNSAPNILKWDNNFSWAYNGDITDSIKERVKNAGGNVTGDLRVSLSWFNYDDLDIACVEPDGNRIYFGNKHSGRTGGRLDIDMNAGTGKSREAVENIFWADRRSMTPGRYDFYVNNFNKRENIDVGFDIQVEHDGNIINYHYPTAVAHKGTVQVLSVELKNGQFNVVNVSPMITSSSSSKELWGVDTEKFVPVSMVMNSPNFWDGQKIGNQHTFFILEGLKNPDPARGFFNEFLKPGLEEHRKVFELLGSKTMAQPTDNQLSGVGFSETIRNSVIVRVVGKTKRIFTIDF